MNNNNPSIGGFDLLSGFGNPSDNNELNSSNKYVGEGQGVDPSFFDDDIPAEVLEKIKGTTSSIGVVDLSKSKDKTEDDDNIPEIDPADLETDIDTDDKSKDSDSDTTTDLSEYESDILEYMTEQFENEVGWKFEDEEKPKSVKELVDYLAKMVETNSKGDFANDELVELNEFVKNGGNIKDYIKSMVALDDDVESLDLDKLSNQKAIIREDLRNRGYNDTKIEKTIEKFEDANMLEDEAKDAKESVIEFRNENKQKLLEDQKKINTERKTQELNFYTNVNDEIKNTKNILGLPLSDKEKRELVDFIFKKESDGTTAFQKYQVKSTTNLIESAYFAKYKDVFTKKVEASASTKAAQALKSKLSTGSSKGRNESNDSLGILSSFGSKLRKL